MLSYEGLLIVKVIQSPRSYSPPILENKTKQKKKLNTT